MLDRPWKIGFTILGAGHGREWLSTRWPLAPPRFPRWLILRKLAMPNPWSDKLLIGNLKFTTLLWNKFIFVPESACEGFFVKKAAVILDLHTFTPADLDLHTLTSADLHLHTFTSADLDLHTLTSADLDIHTFTPADLDLHTLTSADLHLHTLTSADLHLHTSHTCRSRSSHPSHLQI